MKKITQIPVQTLGNLGETTVFVAFKGLKNFFEFLLLILKLLWGKTVTFRTKVLNIAKYLFIFVASPFVKLSINFNNMRRDMKKQKKEQGTFQSIMTMFLYLSKFIFGKRGLAVTAFNYGAPILSVALLFNVITYATSSSLSLKLTVNGEFLGYIENEQVFLNAEAFVEQRINYFGSDNSIEIIPEFSIANSGSNEMLTWNQVANLILKSSDFTLVDAYGFFIDGVCYGAVLEKDFPMIKDTIESLKNEYKTGATDEEIDFINNVVCDWDLFLDESIVDPQEIITMITAKPNGQPFLKIMVTRSVPVEEEVYFQTVRRDDNSLYKGQSSIIQNGENGVNRVLYRISYENNVEINRTPIKTTVISEPVTKIVLDGTKPPQNGTSVEEKEYGKFMWPVIDKNGRAAGTITRGHFSYHRAVDITGSGLFGTPIVAGDKGTVIMVRYNHGGYGHVVMIRHEDGFETLYSHLNTISVKEGQQIGLGEQVGTLGETGRAFGAHLHFEVRSGGMKLNPNYYLPKR
jgi:hypothetical protein